MLDTDLAAALGMLRPSMIRTNLITPNREELEGFGSLLAAQANPSPAGGRPATAYHLNEEQALLICMLSRTERAKPTCRVDHPMALSHRLGARSLCPQIDGPAVSGMGSTEPGPLAVVTPCGGRSRAPSPSARA